MKILLVTSVYKNEVVGPARFARLLESEPSIDVDILTYNVAESRTVKSVQIKFPWWQRKLKIYFSRKAFSKKINELISNYDVLLYNSSVLADPNRISSPYIVMVNDEKLATLKFSFRFDYLRRLLHRKIEKNAVQKATKVIVNSNYLKGRIAEAYTIPKGKIEVLYKGISLDNKQLGFEDFLDVNNEIKILFVKNDYNIGGLLELIEALGSLSEIKFCLTIIGTNQKVKNVLKDYDNVSYKIEGLVVNNEVIYRMYDHNILCIPSRFEPLGVAVMEGLAVGIPTVTTNVGGLPEVTNNGEYVWECQPNNPKSIAIQLKSCIENPSLRRSKSEEGKKFIHETFDFTSVANRLQSILKH